MRYFFVSGLILVGLAFVVSRWLDPQTDMNPIARVERFSGQVHILKKHLTQKEAVSGRALVHELESIETNPDGEAILDFPNGYRIRILTNSLVTLDKENEKTVLFIKNGDVKIESSGQETTLLISKGGQRWNAAEYETALTRDDEMKSSQEKALGEGLTPSYISMTLSSQKGTFYRCYTQLLQKNPRLSGEASVSITIQPNGKISRSEITSSSLEDPSFKKCLLEATNRIEFKPFAGEAITTVFPLKFE